MYKQVPFWVIPVTSFGFFILALIMVFVAHKPLPKRQSLVIARPLHHEVDEIRSIATDAITEHDVFHTVLQPSKPTEPEKPVYEVVIPPMPPAPVMKTAEPVKPFKPEFIDPLHVVVKGVMYSSNEYYSRVLIAEQANLPEKLYKVGDHIMDAEIIRILSDRVQFVRLNGQIESVFISAQEAKEAYSQHTASPTDIKNIAFLIDTNTYQVSQAKFIQAVASLAQAIDDADATMAHKNGILYGVRIGNMAQHSVFRQLGFQPNDSILTINNVRLVTSQDRMKAYQIIQENGVITLEIERDGSRMTHTYHIADRTHATYHENPTPEPISKPNTVTPDTFTSPDPQNDPMLKKLRATDRTRMTPAPAQDKQPEMITS